MAFNKIFMKRGFLNYLIFSGILFTNIINPNKSIAFTQENIEDHLRIQWGIYEDVRNRVKGIGFGRIAQIGRQNADHRADSCQQNARRQPKPAGKGLQQGNRDQ